MNQAFRSFPAPFTSSGRAAIGIRGLDELGLSMAEIARHVGVSTSSIARAVARLEEKGKESG